MTSSPGSASTSSFPGDDAAATAPAPVELEDRIAAAVLDVPGVDSLHGGAFGEVATYLPGRKVHGVRTGPDGTEVHVTVVYGPPVRAVAEQVRRAVLAVGPGPVQVTVEDLVPDGPPDATS